MSLFLALDQAQKRVIPLQPLEVVTGRDAAMWEAEPSNRLRYGNVLSLLDDLLALPSKAEELFERLRRWLRKGACGDLSVEQASHARRNLLLSSIKRPRGLNLTERNAR